MASRVHVVDRPERWSVGDRVVYIRDGGKFGPTKGMTETIVRLSDKCATTKEQDYQVFWVKIGASGRIYWTTSQDVVLK